MKIVLTGAMGLVGHAVAQAAIRRGFQVIAVGFSQTPNVRGAFKNLRVDFGDAHALDRLVFDTFPDAIVNTAAVSSSADMASTPEPTTRKFNVELPARLAQLAHHIGSRFYHLSTDFVFDGQRAPFRTTDVPNPASLYGAQKLAAEKEVLAYGGYESTVLRITIVNGNSPRGNRSIHERLFRAWAAGETVAAPTDEIRQPCSADNVADLLVELCERPNLHGIFHWAGATALSRYDIARGIARHFGLPETLVRPATRAESGQSAIDYSFILDPLAGKVKTRPLAFDEQLPLLKVPADCAQWFAAHSAKKSPPRRFVKGVDF